jgi:hypothetical protein
MGARLTVDIRMPDDFDGRHSVVQRHLVPRELRLVGRIGISVARVSFDVVTIGKERNLNFISRCVQFQNV